MEIAVFGSTKEDQDAGLREKAKGVGREIARQGNRVLTGGSYGLPHAVVHGARENRGECHAYSPGTDQFNHVGIHDFPTDGFTKWIFIPTDYEHLKDSDDCKRYRNRSLVNESDAVIIIGGGVGMANEVSLALESNRNIGILEECGGITTDVIDTLVEALALHSESQIIRNTDPSMIIESLVAYHQQTD